jgi:hypothetical protein
MQTSRLEKNLDRRFFGYLKYGTCESHYKFFEWFDDRLCKSYCKLMPKITTKNKLLGNELQNTDVTIRWLQFSIVSLCA